MKEESREPTPDTSQDVEVPEIERRSLDAVFQGAQAFGEATGGLGALLVGVSKVKETFGGGDENTEPPPPSDPPASSGEPN
jgi:hypothetical protein